MILSIGFVFALLLVILPGLLFRRFYFYGEFSKQFSAGLSIAQLWAKCVIPGFAFFIFVYFLYDKLLNVIALEHFIWKFQEMGILISSTEISSSIHDKSYSSEATLTQLIKEQLLPFVGYLILTSSATGWIFGRIVRIAGFDTRFKLLRFKNSWFYLFNGKNFGFNRLKQFKLNGKKILFTKADILIDCSDRPRLYSGFVVDYEVSDKDCEKLERVTLQSAARYSMKEVESKFTNIPGQLFVVDCRSMLNINLTYIATEHNGLLDTKAPQYIEFSFGIFSLLIIPLFIFKIDAVTLTVYQNYFELGWLKKCLVYIALAVVIDVFYPFTRGKNGYIWAKKRTWLRKIFLFLLASAMLYLLLR